MDLSDAKRSAPKTTTQKIGTIESTEDVSCLVVNTANVASTCIDATAMKAADTPCLINVLTEHFLGLVSGKLSGWLCKSHGGGDNVHLTLYHYYDAARFHVCKFATNFENVNILETGRPSSEMDLTFLTKAAVIIKHMTEHFQRLIALEIPDTTSVILSLAPAAWRLSSDTKLPSKDTGHTPEVHSKPKRIRRHSLQMADKALQVDFRGKEVFYLDNPHDPNPFPRGSKICPDFSCIGKVCRKRNKECTQDNVFHVGPHNLSEVERIAYHFILTGKRWFNKGDMRGFDLKPKHTKLLGDSNGPFGG
jgi:hypothetical protein